MKIRKVEKNGIICAIIDSEDKIITDSQSAKEPIKFRGVFAERLNGAVALGGTK